MLYGIYCGMILFAFLFTISGLLEKVFSAYTRAGFSALGMGLFGYLALTSHNVTDVYMLGITTSHVVLFESWDATALMWIMFIFFLFNVVFLFINAVLVFNEMYEPRWKQALRRL